MLILHTDRARPRWVRRLDARVRLVEMRREVPGYLAILACSGIVAMAVVVLAHAIGLLILAQIPGAL